MHDGQYKKYDNLYISCKQSVDYSYMYKPFRTRTDYILRSTPVYAQTESLRGVDIQTGGCIYACINCHVDFHVDLRTHNTVGPGTVYSISESA